MTESSEKKRISKEKLAEVRARVREIQDAKLAKRAKRVPAQPEPRYDEVWAEGVNWLESLARPEAESVAEPHYVEAQEETPPAEPERDWVVDLFALFFLFILAVGQVFIFLSWILSDGVISWSVRLSFWAVGILFTFVAYLGIRSLRY